MQFSTDSLRALVGQTVVIDTAGPIVYLGTLQEVGLDGVWLTNADLHDRRESLVTNEHYVCEARANGVRANRARLFVLATVMISISALSDVIVE